MNTRKCYLCHSLQVKVIRDTIRFDIKRNVLRCEECGLVFLQPKDLITGYYQTRNYRNKYGPRIGKRSTAKEVYEMYLPLKKYQVEDIKNILSPQMRLLDVGCSSGAFLSSVRPYVKECVGVELNRSDADFARKKLNIDIYTEKVEKLSLPPHSFDVITAFEVLEHVKDPLDFLVALKKFLKPKGWICVEVPNINDWLLSVFDIPTYQNFYYREPHLFYYSPKTLKLMLNKAGYKGKVVGSSFSANVLNQINWIVNGVPQKDAMMAYGEPMLHLMEGKNSKKAEQFIYKIDKLFREFSKKHCFGRSIIFIGKVN